jgi:hypothetical protein
MVMQIPPLRYHCPPVPYVRFREVDAEATKSGRNAYAAIDDRANQLTGASAVSFCCVWLTAMLAGILPFSSGRKGARGSLRRRASDSSSNNDHDNHNEAPDKKAPGRESAVTPLVLVYVDLTRMAVSALRRRATCGSCRVSRCFVIVSIAFQHIGTFEGHGTRR